MNIDKSQLTSMSGRQKATIGVVVLVVIVIIWQMMGLMGGGDSGSPQATSGNSKTNGAGSQSPQSSGPQMAQLPQQKMTQEQQSALIKLQQQTQERYIVTLNELQMLKLSQALAETNKDIATAKLATVKAQKDIVDLLTKPAPKEDTAENYAGGLSYPGTLSAPVSREMQQQTTGLAPGQVPNIPAMPAGSTQAQAAAAPAAAPAAPAAPAPANYIAISVSQLLNKWSAVIGYQGKLYNVFVGDVLPPDGSTVIAIDKYSVVLEKDGAQRKVSLVPII